MQCSKCGKELEPNDGAKIIGMVKSDKAQTDCRGGDLYEKRMVCKDCLVLNQPR